MATFTSPMARSAALAQMTLRGVETPAAIVDARKMQHNVQRMQKAVGELGGKLRPHIKTAKCNPITEMVLKAGACGVAVSTLKEAEITFEAGLTKDILYAVCMTPNKLNRALALINRGCDLKLLTDSVQGARAIAAHGLQHHCMYRVFIEVDTDDHRSGVKPDSEQLLAVARALTENNEQKTEEKEVKCGNSSGGGGGAVLAGVMTHGGHSYKLNSTEALAAFSEQERSRCVFAAERLRAAGFACPLVSIGSTPTALSYHHQGEQALHGVSEVRAGVYVFFDLVMVNIGVCKLDNIALSVLTSVIGHQEDKGWVLVDAGWMAMSRDRGTAEQKVDYGYGQVCDAERCEPIPGVIMCSANQEHGIIEVHVPEAAATVGERSETEKAEKSEKIEKNSNETKSTAVAIDLKKEFPVGRLLRVLPNHACATAAQFDKYFVVDSTDTASSNDITYGGSGEKVVAVWDKFGGW